MPGPISEFRPRVPRPFETPAKAAGLSNCSPPGTAVGFPNTGVGLIRSGRGLNTAPSPGITGLWLSITVYGKPERKAARPATAQLRNNAPALDTRNAEGR